MFNLLPSKRMIYAGLGLVVLFSIISAVGAFGEFSETATHTLLLLLSAVVLVVLGIDAVRLFRNKATHQLHAERTMPHHFIVNGPASVVLQLTNKNHLPVTVEVFDHLPASFSLVGDDEETDSEAKAHSMPFATTINPSEYAEMTYSVRPNQRGKALFERVQLRLQSQWGWWQFNHYIALADAVKTYPDFRKIDQEDLLSNTMQTHGSITHQRKRGTGTDFSQLREYRVGDALNHIDYKATARMNKLISKEFQIERDQQVMILLDCSRRLRKFQSGLSHFDYALNTTIFLARTVLNQGDAVGLMSFGSGDIRYCKPRKGRNSVNQLLNQVYDLDTSRDSPDYIKAAEQLMVRQKRRSLVILVTSLQEEDTDEIKTMLRILQKRHVVVIANLKETILGEDVSVRDLDDAIFYASRETYQHYRQQMLKQIQNKKLILLDTYPNALTARLINLYVNIKQSGIF